MASNTKSSTGDNDIEHYLSEHSLPCNARVKLDTKNEEEFYFYKITSMNCLLAKCYGSSMEEYLLHQRPSYTPSDYNLNIASASPNNKRSADKNSNEIRFESISAIPFNYEGTANF
jgi:hypothetical protein